MERPSKVFLTCAELSADRHLAKLARAVGALRPDVRLEGVGGASMREAGVQVHHETVRRARFGLGAFLRASEVLRMLRWTRRHFREHAPPDLMVCCDSWTMNKHFLSIAREHGVPTLYYVSPQVWASRKGRVRRMRRDIDRMAVILPFEEPSLRERGIDATFVGHPLFDELPPAPPPFDGSRHFPNRPPVIALNAGSRRKVARDNFPLQLEVARRIRSEFPQATFVSPTVAATHAIVAGAAAGLDWVSVRQDAFEEAVGDSDACVCVSGTATLHTAALGVPLVAVYRVPRIGWELLGRWIVKTRTFALVNWLHPRREHVVPEVIPWFGDPRPVAETVLDWLRHPEKLAQQRAAQAAVVDPLRKKGASENTANIVVEMLETGGKPPPPQASALGASSASRARFRSRPPA